MLWHAQNTQSGTHPERIQEKLRADFSAVLVTLLADYPMPTSLDDVVRAQAQASSPAPVASPVVLPTLIPEPPPGTISKTRGSRVRCDPVSLMRYGPSAHRIA